VKQDVKVYLRLLSYLKQFWGIALLVVLGFVINAATEVSVAKLLEKIINAIQSKDQSFTTLFPLLVVVLMFFRGLGLFMGGYFTAVISRNLIFNIRQEVFAKLMRLPSQYYLDNSSGHITAKIMYNVEQLTAASTESLKTVLQQGLITLALMGYLIYTNWRLTLIILVFGPLIGLLIRKASKRMRKLSNQVQDTMGDVNHVVQETVNGNMVVKGFAGQIYEQKRFHESSMENLRRGLKMVQQVCWRSQFAHSQISMKRFSAVWPQRILFLNY